MSPDEWLRLISRFAPALRAGGVTAVKLAGCEFTLAEDTAPPPAPEQPPRRTPGGDIWTELGVPDIEREPAEDLE